MIAAVKKGGNGKQSRWKGKRAKAVRAPFAAGEERDAVRFDTGTPTSCVERLCVGARQNSKLTHRLVTAVSLQFAVSRAHDDPGSRRAPASRGGGCDALALDGSGVSGGRSRNVDVSSDQRTVDESF